jgi:hemerythrin
MTDAKWTTDLSVGDAELDGDHRALIDLINELSSPNTKFLYVFNKLVDYASGHFRREEEHLVAIGYPERDEHRRLHLGFMRQITNTLKEFQAKPFTADDPRIAEFLWNWLKSHIMVEDKKYSYWERQNRPRS